MRYSHAAVRCYCLSSDPVRSSVMSLDMVARNFLATIIWGVLSTSLLTSLVLKPCCKPIAKSGGSHRRNSALYDNNQYNRSISATFPQYGMTLRSELHDCFTQRPIPACCVPNRELVSDVCSQVIRIISAESSPTWTLPGLGAICSLSRHDPSRGQKHSCHEANGRA
jgi:hypothetical protein